MIVFPDLDLGLKFKRYTLGGAQFWSDVHWRVGWRIQRSFSAAEYRLLNPKNQKVGEGTYAECYSALQAFNPPPNPERVVLMVHGLMATWRFLVPFRKSFSKAGLECALINYPSTRADLDTHGRRLAQLAAGLEGVKRIDAVTHSMGGLVLSNAVAQPHWPKSKELKKVVMVGPPLRGAAMARLFAQLKVLHPIVGPPLTFLQSGEGAPELPLSTDLMIIAGMRGKEAGFNPLIDGDDDGTVAIAETRPVRSHVFKTVRGQHTWLRHSKEAQTLALDFLQGQ